MGADGRRWASAIVFGIASLALFATSPARWSVAGTITGPKAPSPGRALLLSIEASEEPHVSASGFPASFTGRGWAPCLDPFAGGKMKCFLPPDATLGGLELAGTCGGCRACVPPPGAFAKADVSEVDAWIDGDTATLALSLPSHAPKMIASRIDLKASGASFVTAKVTLRPRGGGAPVFDETQSCERIGCTFLVYDSALGGGHDFDATAEVTGYGECKSKPCTPPKTLHVGSFAVAP